MDESGENGWFSRRNGGETNTNFLLETDADGSQLLPQYEPSMSMYAASLLDLQSETNKCNDSEITNTNELHYSGSDEELFDNHTEQCNTEATSGDEFLRGLKERYRYHEYQEAQASTSFSMNTTKACSASEPPLTTRSIASSPVSNHSNAEQLETIILEGVRQKMPSCDLLNHTEQHQLTDLLKTIVKQEVDKLKEEFVLIPKSEADRSSISESDRSSKSEADRKSKKKRKHHDDRHRLRKEKVARYGSTSSLNDLFRPSTSHGSSTPKRSDGKRGSTSDLSSSSSSKHGSQKREQKHRVDDDFRFSTPRQPKAKSSNQSHRKDGPNDHQIKVKKNTDKTLYLASARAKRCPLCRKDYKRMVSHFRRVHSNYEVYVSRVAPEMAESLLQTQLPAPIKYANASGMQYLKMMCPFCGIEKDFYAPYWANHMRTHTGEYVNKCIECNVLSMNSTHCGWPTVKPKCNLYLMGLNAYICLRCNYTQIEKKNMVSHLKRQHNKDRIAITTIENEYRKIVLMPPLKDIAIRANPNDNAVQVPIMERQRFITGNQSSAASPSSSGVQVIEDVLIRPRNAERVELEEDDSNSVAETITNATESESQYLYAFESGGDDNADGEDIEILGGITSIDGDTATGHNHYNPNIKVDTLDDETLENVANKYNQDDMVNVQMVRPWIEGDYGQKPSINVITQFALYKCMHAKCIFATNSLENWFTHMTVHIQMIDYFKSRDMLEKGNRDKLIKFRECSYCGYEAASNSDVLRHLEEEHHRSIFQCSLCFYRTIEMDNMVLHMNNWHAANGDQNEIYLCGSTREFNQQDEETLDQDVEQNVKKMLCDQGGCTEEYACYDSLYGHLVRDHSITGTYECPYCRQTMGLDESMIVDHLTKSHPGFEEFQCLKCKYGADNVNAIREHMSAAHPSNYLFVGARRTCESNENTDEIQMIYVGDAQDAKPFKLVKCSQPDALNGMDPKVLDMAKQQDRLHELHVNYANIKTVAQSIPRISTRPGDEIVMNFVRYETYTRLNARKDKKSVALINAYKCITGDMVNEMPAIAQYIDVAKEIDHEQCKDTDTMSSMLIHRFAAHPERPMVFLHTEHQQQLLVNKIIRCTFECELCAEHLGTRLDLSRHFLNQHPLKWFAAKIFTESQVIESNDTQQPLQRCNTSFDYYFCSYLKCAKPDCGTAVGTRTKAIEHYNECHNDIGSKIDGFEVKLCERILHHNHADDVESLVQESGKTFQMHLFECLHCRKLFDSLASIEQHFATVRIENAEAELRFVVKRLFRCLHDNVLRTYDAMKQYGNYRTDVDKRLLLPVNMLWPKKCCGLCSYDYKKSDDLVAHYMRRHIEPDAYSESFLDSLGLKKIDEHLCKFAPGCCDNDERDLLQQIADHVLNCERRFVCAQCPNRKFNNATTFVMHRMGGDHGETIDLAEFIDDLHNFKKFQSLLSVMQIILPNGLVVAMKDIRDTAFGFELITKMAKLVQSHWAQERSDFQHLMDQLHAA